MNKQARKINGFRFVTALAAAELELRKQEGASFGFKYLANQHLIRPLIDAGFVQGQAIATYADAMDFALCFVMRYQHAIWLYGMAKRPLGLSDSAIKRHKYIQNRRWARLEAERKQDDEYESEEDAYEWATKEAEKYKARTTTEEYKRKRAEAEAAQAEAAQAEAHKVQSWAESSGFDNPWDVLLRLSEGTLKIKEVEPCGKE